MSNPNGLPPQTPPPGYPEGFQSAPLPEAMQTPAPLPHNQPYVDPSQAPAPQQYTGHQNPAQQYTPLNYPAQQYPPQQYVQPAPVPQYQPTQPSATYLQEGYPSPAAPYPPQGYPQPLEYQQPQGYPTPQAYPQHMPQVPYPGAAGFAEPATSTTMAAPKRKGRLGLILGILVTVIALVVGAIFAVPYLIGSSLKTTSGYPLIAPSNDWSHGASKAWTLSVPDTNRNFYAWDDHMVLHQVVDGKRKLTGWTITGKDEPQKLWESDFTDLEIEQFYPHDEMLYMLVATKATSTGGSDYAVRAINMTNGEINDQPLAQEISADANTYVTFRDDYYVQCLSYGDHNDAYQDIHFSQYAVSLVNSLEDSFENTECGAYSYSNKERWHIAKGEFPADKKLHILNIDTGELTEVKDDSAYKFEERTSAAVLQGEPEKITPTFSDINQHLLAFWEVDGTFIGTLEYDYNDNLQSHQLMVSRIESASPEEIRKYVKKGHVSFEDIFAKLPYVKDNYVVTPRGNEYPLYVDENAFSRVIPSQDNVTSALWNYDGDIIWLGTSDVGFVTDEEYFQSSRVNRLARPDLLVSLSPSKGELVGFVPETK